MRKLVLLLVCLVLFLFYSAYSDCPTVDNITSGKILEDFKNYFNSDSKEDSAQNASDQERSGSLLAGEELKAAEKNSDAEISLNRSTFNASLTTTEQSVENSDYDAAMDDSVGNVEDKPRKFLDLTLPQLVDEVMDVNIFKSEYKSILPDLFKPVSIEEEEEDRTSFGGRVLMDESFNKMEVDELRIEDLRGSIEGAELTFEVKTN